MDAVVFDFDGVLADSMPQHVRAYQEALGPRGLAFPDRRIYELEGARSEDVIRVLFEDAGQEAPEGEGLRRLADRKQEAFRALGTPRLYEEAPSILASMQDHARTAVVTGTRRENLEAVLGEALGRFDAVIAQDGYTHSKPHPEPYTNAAKALGLPPGACLAVENAPRGIASAKAAGYGRVWAVCTTVDAEALAGADRIFDGLATLHEALLAELQ